MKDHVNLLVKYIHTYVAAATYVYTYSLCSVLCNATKHSSYTDSLQHRIFYELKIFCYVARYVMIIERQFLQIMEHTYCSYFDCRKFTSVTVATVLGTSLLCLFFTYYAMLQCSNF